MGPEEREDKEQDLSEQQHSRLRDLPVRDKDVVVRARSRPRAALAVLDGDLAGLWQATLLGHQ